MAKKEEQVTTPIELMLTERKGCLKSTTYEKCPFCKRYMTWWIVDRSEDPMTIEEHLKYDCKHPYTIAQLSLPFILKEKEETQWIKKVKQWFKRKHT